MITTSASSRDACRGKGKQGPEVAYVVDAAGFFAGLQNVLMGKAYTAPEVLSEVKDESSRRALELGLAAGKVIIAEPSEAELQRVIKVAESLGELGRLSTTDLRVLGIAYSLVRKGFKVVVVSDDRSVQNVALGLGAEVMGVKRASLRRPRRYVYVCPACGAVFDRPGTCPRCGAAQLKRRRA